MTEEQEIILSLFTQGCMTDSGLYDHAFLSAYEYAQAYLIERGIITLAQCARP
jgi:hypothetical protein